MLFEIPRENMGHITLFWGGVCRFREFRYNIAMEMYTYLSLI